MAIGTFTSIITLNVNGLNAPTKSHRLVDGYKIRPIYMLSTRNPLQTSRYIYTESERMEKCISCKWEAKAGVAILISDKIDFKIKNIPRDK